MSPDNKEILEKGNAMISAGDFEGFLALCTEDTHWHFLGDRVLSGKVEVRQYMAKAYIEPPSFKVVDMIGDGELVTAVGEISLLEKDRGWVRYAYCDIWRFDNGKMAELRAFVVPIE